MVERPEFSERVFEFAFNAEFSRRHSTLLAACPGLPSLQEEKKKGYDVKFELKKLGGRITSLFLQHKVSRRVTNRCGSNAHFYDFAGGPYFAFSLDIDQYNLIRRLARRRKKAIYYCAPLCADRRTIDKNFLKRQICQQSVWISVAKATAIKDTKSHSIIYDQRGSRAALFSSKPQKLDIVKPADFEPMIERYPRGFDQQEAKEVYDDVYETLKAWWPSRRRPPPAPVFGMGSDPEFDALRERDEPPARLSTDGSRTDYIEQTASILAVCYGLSWVFFGAKEVS